MENNKSNNKLVITLIIIIVLLLTGGGFLVYTLLSNNPNFNLGGSDSSNSQLSGEENNINNNIDGNITQESIQTNSNTAEFYIRYTKKDENGNIIWTYTTQSDVAGQLQTLGTLKETTDKIYINDKGTIVVLNKETGKVIVERFKGLDPLTIPGVIVASHGPFTWGKDAKDSVKNAIILEEVAMMAWHTILMNPDVRFQKELLDKHYLRKHGEHAYYGQKE